MPAEQDPYMSDGQRRASEMLSNPRYHDGSLTPEAFTEKMFPDYHHDILDSIAGNVAGSTDMGGGPKIPQHSPLDESELNHVHQLISTGAAHAQKAAAHHINERYEDAHASLQVAATSYDTAATMIKSAVRRNHGLGVLHGGLNMNMMGNANWGKSIANGYAQTMRSRGRM